MTDNITIATTATTKSILAPKRLTPLVTPFLEFVQNLDDAIDNHDDNKLTNCTTLGLDKLLSKQCINA